MPNSAVSWSRSRRSPGWSRPVRIRSRSSLAAWARTVVVTSLISEILHIKFGACPEGGADGREQAADGVGGVHAGRERHGLRRLVAPPRHRARLPDLGLLREARPDARGRVLRPHVLRRPPGHARHLRRVGRRGGAHRRPPGEAGPEHRARHRGRGHPEHRARGHVLDDVLLALPRGPDVRHARPSLGRPGRVERGDVGERRRGAELRPQGAPRRTTRATTGPTSSSRRRPVSGTAGTTTRWCSTARRRCSPTPTRCTSSTTRGSGSTCAARSPCPGRRRAGPSSCRRGRRAGAASSPPSGRS